ncbi:hypothetical protein DMN91_000676 [Ooceraea biroi]|uniref:Uncharacterized protein n=1 Tax=Ooceraea biroi TaxID=2015173 RepID=A0A3L8E4G9_OOCBI|nr:hypothetical protein DMN91_000676 [Ooceraea biroi]
MPRPRISCAVGNRYVTTLLPKRPQSPVRHILPERFDLHARVAELLKRQNISNARRYLWEFKDRISQSVKQVSYGDIDFDLIICMLVLRALCEQVILAMAGTNTGTDVHTFVNTAIIWALTDLQILDSNTLDEQERITELKSDAGNIHIKHKLFYFHSAYCHFTNC